MLRNSTLCSRLLRSIDSKPFLWKYCKSYVKVMWTNRSAMQAACNSIFGVKRNYSLLTMISDESRTLSWSASECMRSICLQMINQHMWPTSWHPSGFLSCLNHLNATPIFTSVLARLWSWTGQVECSTISVDTVRLLAPMTAAHCVCMPICFISGNLGNS